MDLERGEQGGKTTKTGLSSWAKPGRQSASDSLNPAIVNNAARNTVPVNTSNKAARLRGPSPEHLHSERFRALPYVIRGHVISMLGELIGTFSFLFFAFSATQVAINGNNSLPWLAVQPTSMFLYISLAFGFSLAVNAWTFFRVSGGLFNPAVNFALCLVGALTWTRGGLLFMAQIIGALIAAAIVSALFPGDLSVDTALGLSTNIAQGFFIEAFATFELVLVILMLAAEKHDGRFLAPVGIGLALFVAELSSVPFTGGSLNPARSFAPSAVNQTFPGLGPLVGAAVAAFIYKMLKFLEYETANPDSVDPALSEEPSSVVDVIKRSLTMPLGRVNQERRGSDRVEYQDAKEWPLANPVRRPTGFGEGLISAKAQGSTKTKRAMPD